MARNGLAKNEPYLSAQGYLHFNGRAVHREVWSECKGPIPKGYIVHHKNGDKTDNRLENLELMSAADHCRHHSPRTGTAAPAVLTCAYCDLVRTSKDILARPRCTKCNRCRGKRDRERKKAVRYPTI